MTIKRKAGTLKWPENKERKNSKAFLQWHTCFCKCVITQAIHFEVDFLWNNNSWEVVKTLKDIYKTEGNIKKSTKCLESKTLAVAGKEVLRLAEKVGKGWFALMIAENLVSNTYIPNYILQALAFACSETIDGSSLRAMGLYRIRERRKDDDFKPVFVDIKKLKKLQPDEFNEQYKERLPKDQLTKFIKLLEDVRNDD